MGPPVYSILRPQSTHVEIAWRPKYIVQECTDPVGPVGTQPNMVGQSAPAFVRKKSHKEEPLDFGLKISLDMEYVVYPYIYINTYTHIYVYRVYKKRDREREREREREKDREIERERERETETETDRESHCWASA